MKDYCETTRILLRTHVFDDDIEAFVARLDSESGHRVTCVVDETRHPVDCRGWEKLAMTRNILSDMGLYCEDDFGWRCGDYALYLANSSYPEIKHFWMIEYDLRFSYHDVGDFFSAFFDHRNVDFIAPYLSRRFRDWYWYSAMARYRYPVYGCFFPIVRISAPAIEHLNLARCAASSAKRAGDGHRWPNDESFVATELTSGGFRSRDLNSFGRRFYGKGTLKHDYPFRGADFQTCPPDRMVYHPVLYGSSYDEKLARQQLADGARLRDRIIHHAWRPIGWCDYVVSGAGRKYGFRG